MIATPLSLGQAIRHLDDFLNLPKEVYMATVCEFAQRLPPTEVLEAVEISQRKIPEGGMDAFKYFCGVCHSKIREHKFRRTLN